MRSAKAVTNGFFAGGVAMNCRICTIVARRMNRGGNRSLAISPRASAMASSMRALTWPRRAT